MPGPMLEHLGTAAPAVRQAAGLRQIDIATAAGVAHTSISRFELAESWPMDPERIVNAYAEEAGVAALELWQEALAAWAETSL